jgi:hypothetical protein
LLTDSELNHLTRERESPFAQGFAGEMLGHDKLPDDFEEIMNPPKVNKTD